MVDMIDVSVAVASTEAITSNEWRGLSLVVVLVVVVVVVVVVTCEIIVEGENAVTVSCESIMHEFRQNAIILLGAIMLKRYANEMNE
jgi:hypothetical protein